MKIQFLGHACFYITTKGRNILVDPFISGNDQASSVKMDELKPDYILLTHAHQDHVLDAEDLAKKHQAQIISNHEIATYYGDKGLDTHGMNTGGTYGFDFGKVTCVVAHHSSVFDDGTYGGNPNGYIIDDGQKRLYIAGDTALTYDMKLIPEFYGAVDVAILPVGDNFTMDYKAAAKAADFVQCKEIIGCHYDTFPPIKIDHQQVQKYFEEQGLNLLLADIGATKEY
ncbi:MAG: metal-dependent hydrolase [Weeksellaceae bacterium]|nr:metal-dependent hydrolase [Weeksellaceae bacterium]